MPKFTNLNSIQDYYMYDKIMEDSTKSLFASLVRDWEQAVEERTDLDFNDHGITAQEKFENEWMQEYRVIYNSYILEGKEA